MDELLEGAQEQRVAVEDGHAQLPARHLRQRFGRGEVDDGAPAGRRSDGLLEARRVRRRHPAGDDDEAADGGEEELRLQEEHAELRPLHQLVEERPQLRVELRQLRALLLRVGLGGIGAAL
jgi:hypothetical protein